MSGHPFKPERNCGNNLACFIPPKPFHSLIPPMSTERYQMFISLKRMKKEGRTCISHGPRLALSVISVVKFSGCLTVFSVNSFKDAKRPSLSGFVLAVKNK